MKIFEVEDKKVHNGSEIMSHLQDVLEELQQSIDLEYSGIEAKSVSIGGPYHQQRGNMNEIVKNLKIAGSTYTPARNLALALQLGGAFPYEAHKYARNELLAACRDMNADTVGDTWATFNNCKFNNGRIGSISVMCHYGTNWSAYGFTPNYKQ